MNVILASILGIVIGALEGATIFFVPEEPHKVGIFLGATLKGLVVGLLVGLSLSSHSSWLQGIGFCLAYGFVLSLMITLPDGGFYSKDGQRRYCGRVSR